jgi:hypothetical protein
MSFDPANIEKWPEYVQDLYYEGLDLIQYIDKVKNYDGDIDEAMELETDLKRWLHQINLRIIPKTLYKNEDIQQIFDEVDRGIFANDTQIDQAVEYALKIIESVPFDKIQENAVKKSITLQVINYVDISRIEELDNIKNKSFDLSKLIQFCRELNSCFRNCNYLAIAMIIRAIIDHVPPIFGCKIFSEVCNNYKGTKSFKYSMLNLDKSLRKISDNHLHSQIRKTEVLPNRTQVNFSNDLDVLLAEIVRLLK